MSILKLLGGNAKERVVETETGVELVSENQVHEARARAAEVELNEIESDPDRQLEVAADNELLRIMKIQANIDATKPKLVKAKEQARKNLNKKYGSGEIESRIDLGEIRQSFSTPFGKVALCFLVPALIFWGLTKVAPVEAVDGEVIKPLTVSENVQVSDTVAVPKE